jgi:cation transport ATPase
MSETERPIANYRLSVPGQPDRLANIYVLHEYARRPLSENPLFLSQLLQFLFSVTQLVFSMLIVTDVIRINNYTYLITSLVAFGALTLFHFIVSFNWRKQAIYSHLHNNEIYMGFFFWFATTLIGNVALSVWLFSKNDTDCCGYDNSQPDRSPFSNEYPQFIGIFCFILAVSILSIYATSRSLVSHYYPESRSVPTQFLSDNKKKE